MCSGRVSRGQVPLDDDPVETVVYQREQAAKQRAEGFHQSSPSSASIVTPAQSPLGVARPTARITYDQRVPTVFSSTRAVACSRHFLHARAKAALAHVRALTGFGSSHEKPRRV